MSREKKLKKSSVLTLMFFTLGSRVLGLVREAIRSRYLGDGILNDSFNVAFMIPNLLRRLFAESSMTVAFIPTFKGLLKKDDEDETKAFLNSIFTSLTFLVTLTVILGMVFTPLFIYLVDSHKNNVPELTLLTRIMFPYLAFISLAALFQGILNSLNIFGPGGFVPILYNIIVITSTIVFTKLNITANPARAMAVGVTLGGFGQMAFQLPYIIKNGFGFKFTGIKKAFNNPGTKNVGRLLAPTLASMGAYQLNTVVATYIAYNTGEGISTALVFSLRLQELVLGIFAVSIGTVLISALSRAAKDEDWNDFQTNLRQSLNAIALITIPVTVFAFIHSTEIVSLVFKGGAFGTRGVALTSSVFKVHISGLYFIALTRILAPAFFSLEDSKTPAILGIISVLTGVAFMFILAPLFKGNGIAAATILSSIILAILYSIFLQKKKELDFKTILKSATPSVIKIILASAIGIIPLHYLKTPIFNMMDTGNSILDLGLPMVITTLLYFTCYVIILIISREESLKEFKGLARKR